MTIEHVFFATIMFLCDSLFPIATKISNKITIINHCKNIQKSYHCNSTISYNELFLVVIIDTSTTLVIGDKTRSEHVLS